MKLFLSLLFLCFFSAPQAFSYEERFFHQAIEAEFSRVDRIGTIDYLDQDNNDCPLVMTAMVSGSYSRSSRVLSYECSACAQSDDNYFVDIFDLVCQLED